MYLVDTNVLSAGAPTKAQPQTGLRAWMEHNSGLLYLSVVTVAEIEDGIAKAAREGAHRKALQIAEWLETVLHLYRSRILLFDVPTARLAGRLSDLARSRGAAPGFADLAIAATAQNHTHVVLTRNLRHFAVLGVPAHDPFVALP